MKIPQKILLKAKNSEGFSLLEVAVVIAVISILSSFAIPNVLRIGKDSDISEAQALLNNAAADCLQSYRNGEDMSETSPNEIIISDERLSPINYRIKRSESLVNDTIIYNKCNNFRIEPFANDQSLAGDGFYYTLGFRYADGQIIKIATDEAVNNRRSCFRWAGINCKFDEEEEKKWIAYYDHLKKVTDSKQSCIQSANSILFGPPAYTGMYTTWDPLGDSACQDDPPNIPSENCDPNSCTQIAFAKDGQPLQGEDALNAALCADWLEEMEVLEHTTIHPPWLADKDPLGKCIGNPDFWFVNGIDQGSEDKFKEKLCDNWLQDKEDNLYTTDPENGPIENPACGNKEHWFFKGKDTGSYEGWQSAKCEEDIENLRASGFNGIYSEPGPTACSQKTYICANSVVNNEDYYKTCGAIPPEKCKTTRPAFDQDCADYELNDYKMLICGPRPGYTNNYLDYGYQDPYPCGAAGYGAPETGGWDKTPICAEWAKKCDLYE